MVCKTCSRFRWEPQTPENEYLWIMWECGRVRPVATLVAKVSGLYCLACAYMAFHAEGITGIELQYTSQPTFRPVRSLENDGHHFLVAESALPAVDEAPTNVPSFPLLPVLLCT